MSFFRRMFGDRSEPARPPIDEMTIMQVFDFLRTAGGAGGKASEMIAAFRRLTELALFEHGIPDAERNAALEVATSLHTDIQAVLANDPEGLNAFEEAADFHLSHARHSGYGSLHWLMEEQGIGAAEVIEFIARPEHVELLPAYLEMMEPEVIAQIRAGLLWAMGRSRAADGEDPVAALNRLAATNDGAMTMLLSGPELSAIRNASDNLQTAIAVLRDIGVQFD
jgi:hypothetical protein